MDLCYVFGIPVIALNCSTPPRAGDDLVKMTLLLVSPLGPVAMITSSPCNNRNRAPSDPPWPHNSRDSRATCHRLAESDIFRLVRRLLGGVAESLTLRSAGGSTAKTWLNCGMERESRTQPFNLMTALVSVGLTSEGSALCVEAFHPPAPRSLCLLLLHWAGGWRDMLVVKCLVERLERLLRLPRY